MKNRPSLSTESAGSMLDTSFIPGFSFHSIFGINLISIGLLFLMGLMNPAYAAGTLTPVNSGLAPLDTRDHHVDVVINNGFAITRVDQVFFNPNNSPVEAVYRFPVPQDATLVEVSGQSGEVIINGEVVARNEAEAIYEEEKKQGNDTGIATKSGYRHFEFRISPVQPQGTTTLSFAYYQALKINTGIGSYLYPLEEGGTDEAVNNFWFQNETVSEQFSVTVSLKSAWPLMDVRVPGFTGGQLSKTDEYEYTYSFASQTGSLGNDFLLYYRLADNLPGRVEVIPYKPASDKQGTFMAVITPGLDLQPLTQGSDYLFVLDTSGSMQSKINMLAQGVGKSISNLRPQDRFFIIQFDSYASKVTKNWLDATPENVEKAIKRLSKLRADNSTNIYAGLQLALDQLDADRVTHLVLVTDGVTNTGVIEPVEFHNLLKINDIRIYGFLLGNSANWPLMRIICETSGGFYTAISNADDIVGQVILAKGKIAYECLHDATLSLTGDQVVISEIHGWSAGKIYRGEQLVLFGQYDKAGDVTLRLKARISGHEQIYETQLSLPDIDRDNPEIERLWALKMIDDIEMLESVGMLPEAEAGNMVRDLGIAYQLVTDETAMLLLNDAAFEEYGIDRKNRERLRQEHQAQMIRAQNRAKNYQVDKQNPLTKKRVPSLGGGGALDPFTAAIILISITGLSLFQRRKSSLK